MFPPLDGRLSTFPLPRREAVYLPPPSTGGCLPSPSLDGRGEGRVTKANRIRRCPHPIPLPRWERETAVSGYCCLTPTLSRDGRGRSRNLFSLVGEKEPEELSLYW
jgi:hypothetical protein